MGSEDDMRRVKDCTRLEGKLIEFLDGKANPSDRRAVQKHLNECAACKIRADEFRALWGVLDDVPTISPSAAFDASVRSRIAAQPVRSKFWNVWNWLPAPRFTFALAALLILSVWVTSTPRVSENQAAINRSADAEFRMIRDLPVLENYDVLSKLDVLSELPVSSEAGSVKGAAESR